MTAPEHDPATCATLRRRVEAAWAALDRQGAVVVRVELEGRSAAELQALVWHEERRVRALAERDAPDPQPFNWRSYRASLTATVASHGWVAA